MFSVSDCSHDELMISLAAPEFSASDFLAVEPFAPAGVEWLTVRTVCQSCYTWIEDAASSALFFTVKVYRQVRSIICRTMHSFIRAHRGECSRMILCRMKQLRL